MAILFSLFLTACGQDVRDLRLDEVDLSDRAVVQQIGRQLGPADKVAFTTYLVVHGPASLRHCGHKRSGHGKEVATIGDAIELMRLTTAQIPRAVAKAG